MVARVRRGAHGQYSPSAHPRSFFGEITTGASNNLEKVSATAKQIVMRFGMTRSSARACSATTTASRSWAASSPPSPTTPTRSRETIEKEQFEALLAGKTEEEVYGSEAPPPPDVRVPRKPAMIAALQPKT
jgi:cell division protease FtsH